MKMNCNEVDTETARTVEDLSLEGQRAIQYQGTYCVSNGEPGSLGYKNEDRY